MNKFILQQSILFLSVIFFLFSFVYTEDINIQTGDSVVSWNQSDVILYTTWTLDQTTLLLTWQGNFSWINETPIFLPFLRFEEIFPKDTLYYWEYLLITSNQNFSWIIRILWAGTSSSEKQIIVTMEANKPCVFTDRPELFRTWNNQCLYYIPSMTLTDNGEPLEIREWINLHHKIIYTGSSDTIPLHWWWIIHEWWYELFTLSPPFSVLSKKDILVWTWNNWTWIILSWNNTQTTWNNNIQWTWIISTWINSDTTNNFPPFQIEEIYPFDDIFAELDREHIVTLTALYESYTSFFTTQHEFLVPEHLLTNGNIIHMSV